MKVNMDVKSIICIIERRTHRVGVLRFSAMLCANDSAIYIYIMGFAFVE